MKENSIRRAVREGRAALGTGLKEFASRGVPWIIEASGFDYCMIDHEHGAFDLETITVSYAGQDGTPKPFLMIFNWVRVSDEWKIASEIILPVPPAAAVKG